MEEKTRNTHWGGDLVSTHVLFSNIALCCRYSVRFSFWLGTRRRRRQTHIATSTSKPRERVSDVRVLRSSTLNPNTHTQTQSTKGKRNYPSSTHHHHPWANKLSQEPRRLFIHRRVDDPHVFELRTIYFSHGVWTPLHSNFSTRLTSSLEKHGFSVAVCATVGVV